jgi:hypothetical protein
MIACLLEDLDEKNATAFSNPQMGPELHGACFSKNPKISFFYLKINGRSMQAHMDV